MLILSEWTAWSSWSSCSVSCGGGLREAERRCLPVGSTCPGSARQEEACEEQHCPGESCFTFYYSPSGLQVVSLAGLDLLLLNLWTFVRLTLQVRDHSPLPDVQLVLYIIGCGQWCRRQPTVESNARRGTGCKRSAASGSMSVQVGNSPT